MIWETIQEKLQAATDPKYRIHKLLGYGGMAGVYLAEQPRLGRFVAIKVVSPLFMADPQAVDRFLIEARTVAKLSHPNIVTIHEIEERDGLHYFTMAFVPGHSLGAVMDEKRDALPVEVIKVWLAQVGSALDYAHRQGVVHRDIKPTNIILDGEGNAQVTDFGIAKVADQPGLTKTGVLIGTPSYMSPEQCSGGVITGQSDQYSLGTVAYQLVTGRPPFEGSTMSVLDAHLREEPAPVRGLRPDCPPEVADAIEGMLRKSPDERWPSIGEALTGLVIANPDLDIGIRTRMARISAASGHLGLETGSGETPTGDTAAAETPVTARTPADQPEDSVTPPEPEDGWDTEGAGGPETRPNQEEESRRDQVALPPRAATIIGGAPPVEPVEPPETVQPEAVPLPASPEEANPSVGPSPGYTDPAEPMPEGRAEAQGRTLDPLPPPSATKGKKPKKRKLVPLLGGGGLLVVIVLGVLSILPGDPELSGPAPTGAVETAEPTPRDAGTPINTLPAETAPSQDGGVRIEGNLPEDFQVQVRGEGGEARSLAESEFPLPPGSYDLELTVPGMEVVDTTVSVRSGELVVWGPRLEALPSPSPEPQVSTAPPTPPAQGEVRLTGDLPPRFQVTVRGEGLVERFSESSFSLPPGSYQVEIQAEGFTPRSGQIQVPAGGVASWSPNLAPETIQGRVLIGGALPNGATVRLRGNGRDEEISGASVSVDGGSYELRFTAPGYRTQTQQVEVLPGEERSWTPDLIREPPEDLDALLSAELQGLVAALQARDMSQVRSRYPGAAAEVERVLGPLLQDRQSVRDLGVELGNLSQVEVTAERAVFELSLLLSYRDPRNAQVEVEIRFLAGFAESQGRWRLGSLEHQGQ